MSIRLIAIGLAALALAVALFYVHRLQVKAGERDDAVASLAQYQAAVATREKEAAKERAAASKRDEALAITLETANATIEKLRQNPVKSIVYRDKIVDGHSCPDPRIGPDWLRVYSEAADAASRAVHASN